MFKIKRSRKSGIELNEFKDKLWQLIDGRGSIPTKTIIISMDLDPYHTKDYGYFMKIVGDCRKEAILQWTSFKHLHKDNKEIFKRFKEYLFKEHLPLIFFDKKSKAAYIPDTYERMEEWVGMRIATEYTQFMGILQIAEISDMKLLSNEMARKLYHQMDDQKKLFYRPLEDDKEKKTAKSMIKIEEKCKDCFAHQYDKDFGDMCIVPVCIKEYDYDRESRTYTPKKK